MSSSEKELVSIFHFIDDLGTIDGDNFQFETTVKTVYDEKWAVCQAMMIYFIGSEGAMIIPFSKIGCSSNNNLMLNDVYLKGKENDLSALSADFSNPVDISIAVEDKVVSINIDGEEAYQRSYAQSMGRFVGFRYRFIGLGEVINYQIRDQFEDLVYLD